MFCQFNLFLMHVFLFSCTFSFLPLPLIFRLCIIYYCFYSAPSFRPSSSSFSSSCANIYSLLCLFFHQTCPPLSFVSSNKHLSVFCYFFFPSSRFTWFLLFFLHSVTPNNIFSNYIISSFFFFFLFSFLLSHFTSSFLYFPLFLTRASY